MIVYQLQCSDGHRFEAWFRDGATYDAQCDAGEIECPFCGSVKVSKAPMAPHIASGRRDQAPEERAQEVARQILQAVGKLREQVEENCEDVGDQFAEEARRIHYGEAEKRGIYGDATDDEAADLDEEGIEFTRLPWPNRRN